MYSLFLGEDSIYLFKQNSKNMKKVKVLSALLLLASISTLNGCKKEVEQTDSTTNAAAMSSNISVDDAQASSGTQFGAGVQGSTNERTTLYNKFGVKYVRAIVELKNFKGNMSEEKSLAQKGYKVVLTINWANPSGSGDHRKPVPFPTDMNLYRNQLTKLFNTFKPEVAVIENEPTTGIFHSGPIEHYITELKTAVSVCNQFNVKVADGCTHVPYILSVMNGGGSKGKVGDVKKLITAYKSMALDYVNVHTYGPTGKSPDIYEPGRLKKVADYLRKQTGKQVMSNEFTVHNYSSALVKNMVTQFKQADFKIAIVRSASSNSGAVPLNRGTNLLPNGVAYSSAIK